MNFGLDSFEGVNSLLAISPATAPSMWPSHLFAVCSGILNILQSIEWFSLSFPYLFTSNSVALTWKILCWNRWLWRCSMFSSYFSIVEAFTTHHIVLNKKVWTTQEGMKYVTNYHKNKVKQCSRRCPSSTCLGLPQLGLLLPIRNASHGIMEHQDHFPPFTRLQTVPWQDKCVFIYQPSTSVPKKT